MKLVDFKNTTGLASQAFLLGLLVSYSSAGLSTPPPAAAPAKDLVLTLSDDWLPPGGAGKESPLRSNPRQQPLIAPETPAQSAKIGCNMDIAQPGSLDNSLSSRMVGKCNFSYRY